MVRQLRQSGSKDVEQRVVQVGHSQNRSLLLEAAVSGVLCAGRVYVLLARSQECAGLWSHPCEQ